MKRIYAVLTACVTWLPALTAQPATTDGDPATTISQIRRVWASRPIDVPIQGDQAGIVGL